MRWVGGLDPMAPDPVLLVGRTDVSPVGPPRAAFVYGDGAAGVEHASWRRAEGARHVSEEDDAFALTFDVRVRDRDR